MKILTVTQSNKITICLSEILTNFRYLLGNDRVNEKKSFSFHKTNFKVRCIIKQQLKKNLDKIVSELSWYLFTEKNDFISYLPTTDRGPSYSFPPDE